MKNDTIWHPNTQMSEWSNFPEIQRAKGMYLIDKDGHKMLDGVASMWCNVWGHSKKELVSAIINQTKKLQHSSMFNITNTPAENLAKQLIKISPSMNKVFFSDNGSTAMEIAIKIALQYWQNIGIKNKTKIMTLKNGYHGDTFGSMSIGYVPEFFKKFKKQLFPVIQISAPSIHVGISSERYPQQYLDRAEKILKNDNKIAALVMESGAQIAGGVIIYPKNFQRDLKKLCKRYNVLFILDEIATGFGRLGSMIEYTAQNSQPDIVSYGKMLTGGYLTMAATLTSKKIYNAFLGDFHDYKHLFHGHTYTGNPIASAVSLENLKLYKKNNLISKIQKTSKVFTQHISELLNLENVTDIRHKGMLMGIELGQTRHDTSLNKRIFDIGRKNGIYLRVLGNIVMLVPPLDISNAQLDTLLNQTKKTIKMAF